MQEVLDLTVDERPRERGTPVRISGSAVLVAAMMGVWRFWRVRVNGEHKREVKATTPRRDGKPSNLIVPGCETSDRLYVLLIGDAFRDWRVVGWMRGSEYRRDEWESWYQGRKSYWVPEDLVHDWPPPDVCREFRCVDPPRRTENA
jgi:hypothetical protein